MKITTISKMIKTIKTGPSRMPKGLLNRPPDVMQ